MAFEYTNKKGVKYYLHKKEGKGTLYYFSREKKENACELPKDRTVFETESTGLPVLKKK